MPKAPPIPKRTDSLPSGTPQSPPIPPAPIKKVLSSHKSRVFWEAYNSKSRLSGHSHGHFHIHSHSHSHNHSPRKMSQETGEHMPTNTSNTHGGNHDMPSAPFNYEMKTLFRDNFKTLYEFYESEKLCDVEIIVNKRSFRCHKMVLACSSLYFRAMFMSEMAESKQDMITIHDIDESAMEKLIKFAYTSKIVLTVENVQPILFASSILQIETVAGACCDFMKTHLHPSNCIDVRNFAEQHNRVELMRMADDYILDHFMEIKETEEFKSMSYKLILHAVSSQELHVDSESQVYEAVMKWITHNPSERVIHLTPLLTMIKFPLISPTYLMEKVESETIVKSNLECRDLLDEAKYYQMSIANLVPDFKVNQRTRPRKSYAGVLFCVGGRGSSGDPFKSIECYDPRKNKWFQVAEMNTRRRHVGVCSANGILYAVGGHDGTEHLNSGEVFDPKTNQWKHIAPMGTLRRGIALASLGGPIYAVGGLDDSTCFNSVERYDPAADVWTFVASMNTPRGGVGVAALKGQLYALGGNDGTSSLDRCERYDPFVNKWTSISNMKKRRAGAGVAVLDGSIYVVGGFDDNSPLDSMEKYDFNTDTWTVLAKMSTCRGGVGVGTLGGFLYAVGGHDGSNYLNSVEAYDPITNRWEYIPSIDVCRAGAGVTTLFCRIEDLREQGRLGNGGAAGRL
ncbi:kelch-like protein 8 isoform X1 [Patella vulgata]|uniref:kelch-like protein 8 isoform X1 n=1 Tax=Patella vulgata TaxID=6465 RepID=UPI00217F51BE|nr:kelch-like protein 8 isoform X1 [Patella vulgata]XP_050416865.1 kelch-like protein 8 isoform X1 [Patella vulgata]